MVGVLRISALVCWHFGLLMVFPSMDSVLLVNCKFVGFHFCSQCITVTFYLLELTPFISVSMSWSWNCLMAGSALFGWLHWCSPQRSQEVSHYSDGGDINYLASWISTHIPCACFGSSSRVPSNQFRACSPIGRWLFLQVRLSPLRMWQLRYILSFSEWLLLNFYAGCPCGMRLVDEQIENLCMAGNCSLSSGPLFIKKSGELRGGKKRIWITCQQSWQFYVA